MSTILPFKAKKKQRGPKQLCITCPHCDETNWYSIDNLKKNYPKTQSVMCKDCLNTFELEDESILR